MLANLPRGSCGVVEFFSLERKEFFGPRAIIFLVRAFVLRELTSTFVKFAFKCKITQSLVYRHELDLERFLNWSLEALETSETSEAFVGPEGVAFFSFMERRNAERGTNQGPIYTVYYFMSKKNEGDNDVGPDSTFNLLHIPIHSSAYTLDCRFFSKNWPIRILDLFCQNSSRCHLLWFLECWILKDITEKHLDDMARP